jgi:RND family efflux transporter MFP subunit
MADSKRTLRRAGLLSAAVLVGLALLAGRTVFSRISNARTLEAQVVERNKQYVRVTQPKSGAAAQTVVLPGTLQGYVQAPISARSSGYLKKWYRDIGSRVKQGELLAEIETPEIDQQLSQAVAARQQAASSLALAASTRERWEALRKREAVSQQELDEKRSADAQARANLAAAEANVERLRQMEGFKRVVAPFAGVITRRNVDVGDLIDAGGGAGRALFVMSQTDPLRVYVNVPQSYAHLVKPGQQVSVTQQELRGQSFKGEIVRTAGAIDIQTRTMQVEVMLANKEGKLMPGAYVQVAVPLEGTGALTVPTNVLLFRGEGPRVAVVGADGKVTLRAVKIGRNFGEVLELLDGVGPGDQIILNPPDSLKDGDPVVISQK